MSTKILKPTAENLKLAAKFILSGELVAFPTETVYGLGANGLNEDACRKIYSAKNRPQDKPLTLHVANFEQVEQVAEISKSAEKLFEKFCPGPLTIILPKKNSVPDFVTCGLNSVGIRFPDNKIAQDFINFSGVPIAAPSANISGQNPPKTAEEVFAGLNGRIKIILDGGKCQFGISSTIIDMTKKIPKILRLGAISSDELKNILGEIE